MNKPIVILGVGNYLMGDEGLGVHLAKLLEQESLSDEISVIDGGSGGFKLMEYIDQEASIILVDATLDGKPPGSIRMIEPRFASDFPKAMSTHEIGLKDLVESLILLGRMPRIYLFVVSIAEIQPLSIELSPEVSACLPVLKTQVLELAAKLVEETLVQTT
ncbi:MAG TPA: hydrogenase maturation protease [Cyclobacteriaceae bacterium]|nr:hydrogenase maturation protease [Cyclobacteriaceae bacterium]HRW99894.1 hydrogenase maturation protease [Cyclobacteriaceae bacterium]